MKLCPKCKNLAYENTYFGIYYCPECGWEEPLVSSREMRERLLSYISHLSDIDLRKLNEKLNVYSERSTV
jgi:uncharacterized Zn finger protein (UPF0148 family)